MTDALPRPKNMRTFLVIWIGQLISLMGSELTGFALGVWIYSETGQATPFALVALFSTLPRVVLAPWAGSVADRYNRRHIMLLADTADALITGVAALLLFTGNLQVWHIYMIAFSSAIFGAFQQPAHAASVTMLVPKKDLARAGGMLQMGDALQALLTPVLAGALFGIIGLNGIIIIDLVTYAFAVGALLIVKIPQPEYVAAESEDGKKTSMLKDAVFGWNYLRERPGLFGLLWYFASVNFFLTLSGVLSIPLVLSFDTPAAAGLVGTVGGAAMLVASLIMSAWGGPKDKKVPALILAIGLSATGFLISGLRANTSLIAFGRGWLLFFVPFAAALSQAVFQVKVEPGIQGRVFAIRGMIARSISPIAQLIAGPLADSVFVPMLLTGGALSTTLVGRLIGVGPGRGIGLISVISCLFLWALSLLIYLNPRVRNIETELPDALPDDEEMEEVESMPQAVPVPAD